MPPSVATASIQTQNAVYYIVIGIVKENQKAGWQLARAHRLKASRRYGLFLT